MVRKVGGNANAVGDSADEVSTWAGNIDKSYRGDSLTVLHPFTKLQLTSGAVSSLSLSRFSPPLSFRVTLLSRPLLSRLPLFSYNLLQPLLIFPRATRCVEPIFGYCSLSAFRETPLPYLGSVSKQRTQRTSPGSCWPAMHRHGALSSMDTLTTTGWRANLSPGQL